VHDEADLEWAEENALLVERSCLLYLQPEWSRYEQVIPAVVEYVKNNPSWNVSLQAHKFMHIP
jgi:7-carboxy-7-deazaguanine synthase